MFAARKLNQVTTLGRPKLKVLSKCFSKYHEKKIEKNENFYAKLVINKIDFLI